MPSTKERRENMKNFDDFLNSITPEQMKNLQNRMDESVRRSMEANNGKLPIADQIGFFSLQGSIELLRLYHDWMNLPEN